MKNRQRLLHPVSKLALLSAFIVLAQVCASAQVWTVVGFDANNLPRCESCAV
jgi:hypothetical protein